MSEIQYESEIEPSLIPPLDSSLFHPSAVELDFLHHVVSANDEEMQERIVEVQRMWVV